MALDVEDLLPIHHVRVVDLKGSSDDEAMALAAKTQYEDWRDLRLLEETSAEYRQAVNRLARRLAEIASAVADRPTITPGHLEVGDSEASDDEEELGLMDIIAQGEEAMSLD